MTTLKESKVEAKLIIAPCPDELDALIHLFEFQYEGFSFWFGVADVAELTKVGWLAMPPMAEVKLSDGRVSLAALTGQPSGDLDRIGLVGIERLR